MFLTMAVTLYTYRLVLNALGVEDYGIYNVVGGLVTFFSFFTGTMASATQRFFSFALGQGNFEKLKITFTVNLVIYVSIAIISLILLETIGLWFVNEKLQLPAVRFESARLVFHYSVLMFVSTVFTTPFMAIIIAHEDMKIYAYVSVAETIMKLILVFFLIYLKGDKLALYGLLSSVASLITAFIYIVICVQKYRECQFKQFYWNRNLLLEIVGFTGWTLFGQLTTVIRNQAITILLNQVFNPIVVAARAVAMNISAQTNQFANNFNVGLYSPIIKSYAANDKNGMYSLIFNGSKITFFLIWVFALPLFLEMDIVLKVWLKNPPEYSVLFTRLALVEALINSVSLPIGTAARAPGKMKLYEMILGSIQIAIFGISWLVLVMGSNAYAVFIVAIVINLIMFVVRLMIVRLLVGLPVDLFFSRVIFPLSLVILLSAIPSFAIYSVRPDGFISSCLSMMASIILASISMFFIGINKSEREKFRILLMNRVSKGFKAV
ncbi:oligosaccharide flippase family protein [Emticicia sp. BO119]|nr:oligosaccharide flippase family protein [Emticicia sp. BO119]